MVLPKTFVWSELLQRGSGLGARDHLEGCDDAHMSFFHDACCCCHITVCEHCMNVTL